MGFVIMLSTLLKTWILSAMQSIKRYLYWIVILSAMLSVGCATHLEQFAGGSQLGTTVLTRHAQKTVIHQLYHQHKAWQGVRYQLGGLSKKGVDCSGFVQLTYKTRLGVYLPRTVRQQSKLGKKVAKHELKAGDLVFFKTGPTSKHVGIYLEENKFLHASESKGVTISHLGNVYWKAKYWKSVRV